jgi:hypothetical protein
MCQGTISTQFRDDVRHVMLQAMQAHLSSCIRRCASSGLPGASYLIL